MLEIVSFMAMFMAVERAAQTPVYEPSDFHYFDKSGKVQPLPLQPKIVVRFENQDQFAAFVKNLNVTIEPYKKDAVIINCGSKKRALALFKKFRIAGFDSDLVVMFDGMECVPTNRILFEIHPSISMRSLIRKFVSIGCESFSFGVPPDLKTVKVLIVRRFKTPTNMLTMANMMASDTAWFKWARMDFEPIEEPIRGKVEIVSEATTNLGKHRFLKVRLEIFSPRIKLKTDMLPQIGQGTFILYETGIFSTPYENLFIDYGKPMMSHYADENKEVYEFSYPFRVLGLNRFSFPTIRYIYEENGELKTLDLRSKPFKIHSVTEGTSINDIQPIKSDFLVSYITTAPNFLDESNRDRNIAFVFLMFCLMGILLLGWYFLEKIKSFASYLICWCSVRREFRNQWKDMLDCAYKIAEIKPTDWRSSYTNLMKKVQDLGIKDKNLLDELGKLYKPDETPDFEMLYKHAKMAYKNVV